jgi:hypothetical protein
MNRTRTTNILRLFPPPTIGNGGQSDHSQGVDFKQRNRKVLGITGGDLENEPHNLENGNAFR